MNEISKNINDLVKELTALWSKHNSGNRPVHILNEVYDLIISLWDKGVIKDSRLAMDILHYYHRYRKYKSATGIEQLPNYNKIRSDSAAELERILNDIKQYV